MFLHESLRIQRHVQRGCRARLTAMESDHGPDASRRGAEEPPRARGGMMSVKGPRQDRQTINTE